MENKPIKKILVTGFSHCGTSILKSKIGECSNVLEYPYEFPYAKQDWIEETRRKGKQFIVVKYPQLPIEIRANHLAHITKVGPYKDYTIIFLIRNPWNVFSSLVEAGHDPLNNLQPNCGNPDYHIRYEEYFAAANQFIEAKKEDYPNFYSIRYEDFFENDFENIKKVFDSIGLEYTNDIFYTRTKDYKHWPGKFLKDIKEQTSYKKDRFEHRTWQINQPFENMNTSNINIPEELNKILSESPIVKELGYTDPRIK